MLNLREPYSFNNRNLKCIFRLQLIMSVFLQTCLLVSGITFAQVSSEAQTKFDRNDVSLEGRWILDKKYLEYFFSTKRFFPNLIFKTEKKDSVIHAHLESPSIFETIGCSWKTLSKEQPIAQLALKVNQKNIYEATVFTIIPFFCVYKQLLSIELELFYLREDKAHLALCSTKSDIPEALRKSNYKKLKDELALRTTNAYDPKTCILLSKYSSLTQEPVDALNLPLTPENTPSPNIDTQSQAPVDSVSEPSHSEEGTIKRNLSDNTTPSKPIIAFNVQQKALAVEFENFGSLNTLVNYYNVEVLRHKKRNTIIRRRVNNRKTLLSMNLKKGSYCITYRINFKIREFSQTFRSKNLNTKKSRCARFKV
jgi:hypothetical protein